MIRPRQLARLALALASAGLVLPSGCRCETNESPVAPAEQPVQQSASHVAKERDVATPAGKAVKTLLELNETAYGTTLILESDQLTLLTQQSLVSLTGARPQKRSLPLGSGPALFDRSIAYWNASGVHAVELTGTAPRRLFPLDQPPQRFLAFDGNLAWLTRRADGSFAIETMHGARKNIVYESEQLIAAATLLQDWVFFVERTSPEVWRIGGATLSGKARAFSKDYRGRTPSLLVRGRDSLFFYDGPSRTVRQLSADLQHEVVWAKQVICSPLAVSERVLCAHVEGVFEIPGPGIPPRIVARERGGPISEIAANERRVVWVSDVGENQLAVRAATLAPLDADETDTEKH